MIFFISASIAGKSSSLERLGHLEVVVEAAFDGRPEGELHALLQPHHRPGHDVGRRVPHHARRLGVLLRQNRSERGLLRAADNRGRRPCRPPRRRWPPWPAGADGGGDVAGGYGRFVLLYGTIGEMTSSMMGGIRPWSRRRGQRLYKRRLPTPHSVLSIRSGTRRAKRRFRLWTSARMPGAVFGGTPDGPRFLAANVLCLVQVFQPVRLLWSWRKQKKNFRYAAGCTRHVNPASPLRNFRSWSSSFRSCASRTSLPRQNDGPYGGSGASVAPRTHRSILAFAHELGMPLPP